MERAVTCCQPKVRLRPPARSRQGMRQSAKYLAGMLGWGGRYLAWTDLTGYSMVPADIAVMHSIGQQDIKDAFVCELCFILLCVTVRQSIQAVLGVL